MANNISATLDSLQINTIIGSGSNNNSGTYNQPDGISRYAGGSYRTKHPAVTGYWVIWFKLPEDIFGSEGSDAAKWLHCTAESFTPPGNPTIEVRDVPGMGGLDSSFVVGQTINRDFTVTFREYEDYPTFYIIYKWANMINQITGVGPFENSFIPKNYKGQALATFLKPTTGSGGKITKEIIDDAIFFDGVVPTIRPYDMMANDINAKDLKPPINVTFRFDGFPINKYLLDLDAVCNALNAYGDFLTPYNNTSANSGGLML